MKLTLSSERLISKASILLFVRLLDIYKRNLQRDAVFKILFCFDDVTIVDK